MLPHTPPTYVGTKRRTGPMDFHINKMRALNLSAKYMKKVEAELRGLPGTFNDLPVRVLEHTERGCNSVSVTVSIKIKVEMC